MRISKNLLLIGGIGLAVYYLFSRRDSVSSSNGVSISSLALSNALNSEGVHQNIPIDMPISQSDWVPMSPVIAKHLASSGIPLELWGTSSLNSIEKVMNYLLSTGKETSAVQAKAIATSLFNQMVPNTNI